MPSTTPKNRPVFRIAFPSTAATPAPNAVESVSPIVIVGANGSGKTRLSAWLERQEPSRFHRISAQRSLVFPDDLRGTDVTFAENDLLRGHRSFGSEQAGNKFSHRYPSHDASMDDFQKLGTLLFSEAVQVSEAYFQKMKGSAAYETPPPRRLDKIKTIWEAVLPNRELAIGGNKVEGRRKGGTSSYSAHELSDGERVIFYLVGHCLSAPESGIIIVDEPELHLHRALQTRLWDAVEIARPDCLFIYVTHDLEFAASRNSGTMVLVHEYTGGENWDWRVVPPDIQIPESLLLELLGSRRPILFVEGKRGGLDELLYRTVYSACHVIPVGGCEQVIQMTASGRSLRAIGQLSVDVFGLVDRDGRSTEESTRLNQVGVAVMRWSEIENLFLAEDIFKAVALWLNRDPQVDFESLKGRVFQLIDRDSIRLATEIAGRSIDRRMHGWAWKHPQPDDLISSFRDYIVRINPSEVVTSSQVRVKEILASRDFVRALECYPNKGLLAIASEVLGVKNYADCIIRRISSDEGKSLATMVRNHAAILPQQQGREKAGISSR